MGSNRTKKLLVALAIVAKAPLASAGLMVEEYASGVATPDTLGGWSMTDIGDTGGLGFTNSISSSAFTGSIDFLGEGGGALDMLRIDASTIDAGVDGGWWNNPESTDHEVFTTHVNWVELILPANTRAFSFNVGASYDGWGWLVGFSDGGNTSFTTFNVGPGNTPGFGVYADNSGGSCGEISSVVIDPRQWGVGNLSIAQSNQCTVAVPEPGVLTLLAVGIAGLVVARRREKKQG